MYKFITDPLSNKKYKINGSKGKSIFKHYLEQIGGKYLGHGTYKCVFSPPTKCYNQKKRYGDKPGDSPDNYISALTTHGEAKQENKVSKLMNKIDPGREFTIPIVKTCKIGDLDSVEESSDEFKECQRSNFLKKYDYPFNKYPLNKSKRLRKKDLVLLIQKKGGFNLSQLKKNTTFFKKKENIIKIFLNFHQVLYGLMKINEKGYTHSDIKSLNILFNTKELKYYLIDFGFVKKIDDMYSNSIYDQKYFAWPIDTILSYEFYNFTSLDSTRYESPSIDDEELDMLMYLSRSYSDKRKEFLSHSTNKLDVYSVGLVIESFLVNGLVKYLKPYITNNEYSDLKDNLDRLIYHMTRDNPVKRINIKSSLKRYKLMTNFLEKYITISPVKNTTCSSYKMRWEPKCKDRPNCEWKRGEGCIEKKRSSLKAKKPTSTKSPKYINKIIYNKKPSVKTVLNTDDCGQFKMRWEPKCKDQSNCKWKRGKGCIKKSFKL